MNPLKQTVYQNIIPPAARVDNAAVASATIDSLGFDFITIVLLLGATDIAMVSLKVVESDASNMGSPADIVGTRVGTDADAYGVTSVIPSETATNGIAVFDIDCRGRKRYLDLLPVVGDGTAGTFVAGVAIKSRAKVTPTTAAERGALLAMAV